MSEAQAQEDDIVIDDVINQEEDVRLEDDEPPKKKVEPEIKGYMSKEAWIAAGKDPEEWRDPVEFKWRGELIKQRKEFEDRLKNVNFINQQRLEMEIKKARADRKEAISIADHAAVDALDAQIDAMKDQQALLKQNDIVSAPDKDPFEAQWERENPWVLDPNDPRTPVAISVYGDALSRGIPKWKALEELTEFVDRKYGKPEKRSTPMVEPSRTAAGKRESSGMAWSDLSPQDVKIFNEVWPKTGDANKDKRAFLKAIQDEKKV